MRGGDGVRAKDGVRISILYQTSTISVRQGTQALIKQMWEQIGVETELRNIDAAVFFGGDPASPDTYNKFYADIQMYTNNFDGTDPESYMANWACSGIPGPENQWLGNNIQRQCVAEYDDLVAQMSQTAVLEERAALAKRNERHHPFRTTYMIPLIWRGSVIAYAITLRESGRIHGIRGSGTWATGTGRPPETPRCFLRLESAPRSAGRPGGPRPLPPCR